MELKYRIDGTPCDFREIIHRAQEIGYNEKSQILMTSRAADFLRANGHIVDENPEYKEGD